MERFNIATNWTYKNLKKWLQTYQYITNSCTSHVNNILCLRKYSGFIPNTWVLSNGTRDILSLELHKIQELQKRLMKTNQILSDAISRLGTKRSSPRLSLSLFSAISGPSEIEDSFPLNPRLAFSSPNQWPFLGARGFFPGAASLVISRVHASTDQVYSVIKKSEVFANNSEIGIRLNLVSYFYDSKSLRS
jgi:hypothetical protein